MSDSEPGDVQVRLARLIEAPSHLVYEAWTTPALLRLWWGPGGFTCPEAEIDLRPGGGYRLVMQPPQGAAMVLVGTYREITAPSRLVYTWRWDTGPASGEHESLVTVEFHDRGPRTEVVVSHAQLPPGHDASPYRVGWDEGLDKLAVQVKGSRANA
ncbi:MAG TPA: SRPBCC domain-containing protein [Candidatus Binatia bacterium]|nr:SRPBCC domain-containing protein [Candidatus Binatia bacterium]